MPLCMYPVLSTSIRQLSSTDSHFVSVLPSYFLPVASFSSHNANIAHVNHVHHVGATPRLTSRAGSTTTPAYPPTLLAGPKSQAVLVGGEVVFSCQFQGHPTPEVHWTKEDSKSGRHTLGHVGSVLKITNATSKDAGLYSCTGSNKMGQQSSASARLKVPHIPDPPKAVHLKAFSNGSILLHWQQPRHSPPVSSYSVSYSKCCTTLEWTTVKVAAGRHKRTLQCVLTGLRPGWDYTMNVVAHSHGRHSVPLALNFTTPAADETGVC